MLPAPITLIREATFRRVWIAGACGNTARWLEILAVSIFVFEETGSPFLVALMTVLRALPILIFGTLAGAIAERFDRRRLYVAGSAITAAISAVLGLLAWQDALSIWHIGLGAFLSGVVWSTEHPVRRTMIGDIAGLERIGAAMGLEAATNNATRVVGPSIGGLLYQTVGLPGAYTLGAILASLAVILVAAACYRQTHRSPRSENVLATMIAGLKYVRTKRTVLAALAITVCVNLFGFPYTAMIAVIGRESLDLSAASIGLLMAAEASGGFFGSLIVAAAARPSQFGRLFYFGALSFVVSVLAFSSTSSFPVAFAVLFLGGFGVSGFATMQMTLILSTAEPAMRSRAMGALAVAIGFGPLGMFHLGLMASWLGASTAVMVMSVEGLLALVIAGLVWPELRRRMT